MEDITIPRYDVVIPNCVYEKMERAIEHPLVPSGFNVKRLIHFTRYKVPGFEETYESIKSAARNYVSGKEIKIHPDEEEFQVIKHIKELQESEIEKIIKGDVESIAHLGRHYFVDERYRNSNYLFITSGVVPDEFIRKIDNKRKLAQKHYEVLLSKDGINRWEVKIKLGEDWSLPNKLELEYLLDRGVRDSNVFSVKSNDKNYDDAVSQIRLVYGALNNGRINIIPDDSDFSLRLNAINTILEAAKCDAKEKIIEGFAEKLAKELGKVFNEEKDGFTHETELDINDIMKKRRKGYDPFDNFPLR